MTTFTSDDREEAYKKILAEAPAHIGYEDAVDPVACGVTINVEPIPFAGMVTLTEPEYKDLTDVEIYDVFKGCVFEGGFCKYEFARAILRKAQEK